MSKSKTDRASLVDFLATAEETPQKVVKTLEKAVISTPSKEIVAEKQSPKPVRKAKQGRKSYRKPGVIYERVSVDIPSSTKEMLDLARIKSGSPHLKKHQATIINEAIIAYLGK